MKNKLVSSTLLIYPIWGSLLFITYFGLDPFSFFVTICFWVYVALLPLSLYIYLKRQPAASSKQKIITGILYTFALLPVGIIGALMFGMAVFNWVV